MANCDDFPALYCEDFDGFDKEEDNFFDYYAELSYSSIPTWFETAQEAMLWAKENPGRTIMRSPSGDGFIVKNEE